MTLDPALLQTASLIGYLLVFLGGVVTSIGPCNVATIPLIVGFVGGSSNLSRPRSFTLSLAFAVGLAITFMLLGVFASLVGGLIGGASFWYHRVAAICFVIGLQMLGVLSIQLRPGARRSGRVGRHFHRGVEAHAGARSLVGRHRKSQRRSRPRSWVLLFMDRLRLWSYGRDEQMTSVFRKAFIPTFRIGRRTIILLVWSVPRSAPGTRTAWKPGRGLLLRSDQHVEGERNADRTL